MAALANSETAEVVGILDDDPDQHGRSINGVRVLGETAEAADHSSAQFVVCAGGGAVRHRIVNGLSRHGIGPERMTSVLHPTCSVGGSSVVGGGSIVLANVTLTADVIIGQHVVVMPQAVLTHDDRLGDYATVCAGVALGGNVVVGTEAYVGMNSAVRQNLVIGEGATLGMGSVLLSDLPAGQTWAGNPAALLRRKVRTGRTSPAKLTAVEGKRTG